MSRFVGLFSPSQHDPDRAAQMLAAIASRQRPGHGRPVIEDFGPLLAAVAETPDHAAVADGRHVARHADSQTWLCIDGTLFNAPDLERSLRATGELTQDAPSVAEIALAAYRHWGTECFSHLSGMFAIVILDRKAGTCLLARDQFGAKPVSYTRVDDRLAFASEFRPLLVLHEQVRLNQRALMEFGLHGDVLPPDTLFQDVSAVPAGHYVVAGPRDATPRLHCYFDAFEVVNQAAHDELDRRGAKHFLDVLDAHLHRSIQECMADGGPFGVSLSGGVDSATLAAIAARHGTVRAVHVSVPDGRGLDERPMAERIARHVGIPMDVVTMSGGLYRQELVNATLANEMPLWHVQNVGYYLACRRARELGINALLCGDTIGMNLSPGSHLAWRRLQPLLEGASAVPPALGAFAQKVGYALGDLPLNSHGFGWYLPMAVQMIDGYARRTLQDRSEQAYAFVAGKARRRIMGARLAEVYGFHSRFYYRGDRLGSASAVDYRTPFGDVPALELAMNMPFQYIHRKGIPKWSIKELGSRYIPRDIAFQKKVAWDMPDDIYMRPFATPRFFQDGFLAQALGLSRVTIERQVAIWQREVHTLTRMIHMEVWGRLFLHGESPSQLAARMDTFD